jgi:hypothetical protein
MFWVKQHKTKKYMCSTFNENYGGLFFNVFKVCKSVHHCTIRTITNQMQQFSSFIILTFIYSSTCFGRFSIHHQELTVVLCSWSGQLARPQTQHDCHHDTKVKPEAATAVIELLMMGGKMPETCSAVNKRQDNKTGKLLHLVGNSLNHKFFF